MSHPRILVAAVLILASTPGCGALLYSVAKREEVTTELTTRDEPVEVATAPAGATLELGGERAHAPATLELSYEVRRTVVRPTGCGMLIGGGVVDGTIAALVSLIGLGLEEPLPVIAGLALGTVAGVELWQGEHSCDEEESSEVLPRLHVIGVEQQGHEREELEIRVPGASPVLVELRAATLPEAPLALEPPPLELALEPPPLEPPP